MSEAITHFKELCSPIWNLYSVRSLLYWDQQVLMPGGGAAARANQIAALEKVCHGMLTDTHFKSSLEKAEESASEDIDKRYLRSARRAYDLASKLPPRLVEERARATSLAVEAWVQAKKNNDFKFFLPHLRNVFDLTREVAEHKGYASHPYDALIDEYEPGMTTQKIDALFGGILPPLVQLVQAIAAARPISRKILQQAFPFEGQHEFSRYLLEQIGFDFERGRLDQSAHPFCSSSTGSDVRMTDRLDEWLVTMSIFGSLHEGGHGLYEQGSPPEWNSTPLAGGCSLGIHESQSRMWENFVGRSLPFWQAHFGRMRSIFPQQLWGYSAEDMFHAVNYVEPSFIRVEADEVTYTLHIVMRYELERDMITRALDPADLPEAWNEKMEKTLGIRPPTDTLGCLQDIHWSDGLIGYFPTYSIGNVVAAQLWRKIRKDMVHLDEDIARGNNLGLLNWLRHNLHRFASSVLPEEALFEATGGEELDHQPFVDYLWDKYSGLYEIQRP
ncbi:MAG: carboxypeptidase M32 [Candidatus Eremiobacteraeota bacterium]|nr:carboxypeptidase M32 [Candidatus Eremiobacteraeota bacterium]MCW5866896.1 carboxypeptidase M32 [Candidatus Eremiobacteraeota bacterium]